MFLTKKILYPVRISQNGFFLQFFGDTPLKKQNDYIKLTDAECLTSSSDDTPIKIRWVFD